jgi:hypothetical protein
MNWPALELMIGSIILGAAMQWIGRVLFFRWQKRQEVPDGIHKEVEQLGKDVVGLRVEIARIKGQLNFKVWRKEN